MDDVNTESTTPSKYPSCVTEKENFNIPEDDDRNQVTSQRLIEALSRYTVRRNGAFMKSDSFCRVCYNKYKIGDKIICLPCQHCFHQFCIENWLKWVESACPVDKKSVVRRQYMKYTINERRNQLLEAHNLKVFSTDFENNKECTGNETLSYEKITCNSNVPRKTTPENHGCESSQEFELAKDPIVISPLEGIQNVVAIASPKILLKKRESSKREKDATTHLEARTSHDLLLDKYPNQLRESISAIRKSKREPNRNSNDNPENFQEVLEKVVSKFSNSKIKCSKETMPSQNAEHILEFNLKRSLSSKSKNIREYYVREKLTSKSNVTFGDFLNADKDKSGWVYQRNYPARFKAAMKFN